MNNVYKLVFYFIVSMAIISCDSFKQDQRISEGVIEYQVTYPKLEPGSMLRDLLPTTMTMSFKDGQYVTDLSAGFGLFKTAWLSTGSGESCAQMIKLINEKYVVEFDEKMIAQSLADMPAITIEHTGVSKKIAEYNCQEIIVHVDNAEQEVYTVYYTDEIHLEQPNWFTQFAEINGVLMEYQIEKYDVCTRFSATTVVAQEVEDQLLEVPEDYVSISVEEMDTKMLEIFEGFAN